MNNIKRELGWNVIIKNEAYQVTFSCDEFPTQNGDVKIRKMYCLKKGVFCYVLTILSNGTYRLYSGAKKSKLYIKGPVNKIRFVPRLFFVQRVE
jgi:hypothetical protein